ncbi:hypothetical protein [Thermococcus sp.]|uniref:hypothetical protein n=1 Tax=Thermococcus sp. TaxID=35749 RepID=UPI00262C5334|nr:hypothetical protein [Thermococcus sp.]
MSLTPEERKRYKELLKKFEKYGMTGLTPQEVEELRYYIKNDDQTDEDLKLLVLFLLGALAGYLLAKGK